MRVALIPNLEKPDAVAASLDLEKLLAAKADVVVLRDPDHAELRAANANYVVVLGGDGSILRIAHAMAGIAAPVVGINFGKLGYLAAYSLDEFTQHADAILAGRAPVTERLMLEGSICRNGKLPQPHTALPLEPPRFRYAALNDIVINAGEPFKMIEIHVRIDDSEATTFRGDGVIVSTSSGSTGYNLSSGGPLITPNVHALVLTPICPHSLSFRPVVIADTSTVVLHPHRVNPGTKVVFDGQVVEPLSVEECVIVRRTPHPLRLVENPAMSHWQMLANKLHWAQSPRP